MAKDDAGQYVTLLISFVPFHLHFLNNNLTFTLHSPFIPFLLTYVPTAFKQSDVVARITGFKNPNNFWFTYKIKASKTNIFYPSFVLSFINGRDDDDFVNGKIPPTQSLAQAIFYSMVLPWTLPLRKVFITQSPLLAVCVG